MFCSNSKKKMALIATAFLYISMTQANAQEVNQGPIAFGHWAWNEEVTLNGKKFSGETVADSYREQMGRAIINELGAVTFWLYDTYSYHKGNDDELVNKYIPHWIENYYNETIDFDNIREVSPNENMPSSLKALMKQRGCDVAVAYINRWGPPKRAGVIINSYDKEKNIYDTYIYPLIGNESFFEDFVGEPYIDAEQDLDVAASVDIEKEMILVDNFYITKESIGVMSIGEVHACLYKLNDSNPGFYYRLPTHDEWYHLFNKGYVSGDYPYSDGWTRGPVYVVKEKIKESVDGNETVSDGLGMDSENGADNDFNTEVFKYGDVDKMADEVIRLAQKKAGTDFKEYTGKNLSYSGEISSAIKLKNNYILGVMRYSVNRLSKNHIGFVIVQGEDFKKDKFINEKLKEISKKNDWKILIDHNGPWGFYYAEETEKPMVGEKNFINYLSGYEKVSDELAEFLEIFK